jgi:hypothetical protein
MSTTEDAAIVRMLNEERQAIKRIVKSMRLTGDPPYVVALTIDAENAVGRLSASVEASDYPRFYQNWIEFGDHVRYANDKQLSRVAERVDELAFRYAREQGKGT